MNHKIADVGTEVRAVLLGLVDPRANVAWLHDHCVPEITRHMEEVLEQMDSVTGVDRLEMVEADIGEPVTSYYEYALIRQRVNDSAVPAGRGTRWESRVRVGQRSDLLGEEGVQPVSTSGMGDAILGARQSPSEGPRAPSRPAVARSAGPPPHPLARPRLRPRQGVIQTRELVHSYRL